MYKTLDTYLQNMFPFFKLPLPSRITDIENFCYILLEKITIFFYLIDHDILLVLI